MNTFNSSTPQAFSKPGTKKHVVRVIDKVQDSTGNFKPQYLQHNPEKICVNTLLAEIELTFFGLCQQRALTVQPSNNQLFLQNTHSSLLQILNSLILNAREVSGVIGQVNVRVRTDDSDQGSAAVFEIEADGHAPCHAYRDLSSVSYPAKVKKLDWATINAFLEQENSHVRLVLLSGGRSQFEVRVPCQINTIPPCQKVAAKKFGHPITFFQLAQ